MTGSIASETRPGASKSAQTRPWFEIRKLSWIAAEPTEKNPE